ncbi:MAG: metal ABC transporter substrate-binding protein [Planctomycetota bacterium]
MQATWMIRLLACAALAAATWTLAACEQNQAAADAEAAGEDVVLATFYPTEYFATRIAGGLVEVGCPLPADADPIFWRPSGDAIARYQRAGLVVTNGAEFEKWVAGAPLPRSRVVESISVAALEQAGGPITMETITHSHGPEGEHSHEGIDGHTWVDPTLAIAQVRAIEAAMAARWPEHAADFAANGEALVENLRALDAALTEATSLLEGATLLASHPAYNYLARTKGWDIHNLDLDPESADVDAVVEAVHEALHEHEHDHGHKHGHEHDHGHEHADDEAAGHDHSGDSADADHDHDAQDGPIILLWEGQPTAEIVTALADRLGVRSVLFTPAESRGALAEGQDYLDAMRGNVERLREAASAL